MLKIAGQTLGVSVWPEELGLLISSSTHPIPQKSVIISHREAEIIYDKCMSQKTGKGWLIDGLGYVLLIPVERDWKHIFFQVLICGIIIYE